MSDFQTVLRELAELFRRERIDYMVIGGLAVSLWGTQRSTGDVDIAVAVDAHDVRDLLRALEPQILQILPNAAQLAAETGIIRFRHRTGIPVDLGVSNTPYLVNAVARAVEVEVSGTSVRFATAEDLILHKLLADRDRDREDIRGIVRRQGRKLDRGYLEPLVRQIAEATSRREIETRYRELVAVRKT